MRWLFRLLTGAKVEPQKTFLMTVRGSEGCFSGLRIAGYSSMRGIVIVDLGRSEVIKEWNLENPRSRLEIGHVILEVNGFGDVEDMLEQLLQPTESQVCKILVNTEPNEHQRSIFEVSRERFERALEIDRVLSDVAYSSEDICAICHEEMTADNASLPCGHHFHKLCVKKWLLRGDFRCPLCNLSPTIEAC